MKKGFNAIMEGTEFLEGLNKYYEQKLKYYADRMSALSNEEDKGRLLNGHNDQWDLVEAIVLLQSGEVCPLYGTMNCLNPLSVVKSKEDPECEYVRLSTWSCAGNVYSRGNYEAGIKKYNDDLLNSSLPRIHMEHAIMAYWIF